jgi:ribosome maturation factor RimP
VEQQFMDLCRGAVNKAGCNLVRVSWKDAELTFYIDKRDGVNFDDCEKVTKAVESIVEANDANLGENYRLSVSSVGVDGKDWE